MGSQLPMKHDEPPHASAAAASDSMSSGETWSSSVSLEP